MFHRTKPHGIGTAPRASEDKVMYSLGTALSVAQDRGKTDGGSVTQDIDMGDTEQPSDLSQVPPTAVDEVRRKVVRGNGRSQR